MKKYSIEELKHLQQARYYADERNFTTAMNLGGEFNNSIINDYFRLIKEKSLLEIIENLDSNILKIILDFYNNVVDKVWGKGGLSSDSSGNLKKVVFEISGKIETKELDLYSYTGAKTYCKIHETAERIISVLSLCDKVSTKNNKYINIYEGDLVGTVDTFSIRKSGLYLAFLQREYVNPSPFYKKLVFTAEFGYLQPKKNKPLDDGKEYRYDKSLFNTEDGSFNYHCFTLSSQFKVLGNLFVNDKILKPYENDKI